MDSLNAETMSIDTIIAQLSSLKANSADYAKADTAPIWQADVDACEAAISILDALRDEGVVDAAAVRDLIYDYRKLVKQYRILHAKFAVGGKPYYRDGVWHCPECNHRATPRHSFCHWCGKKLGGW